MQLQPELDTKVRLNGRKGGGGEEPQMIEKAAPEILVEVLKGERDRVCAIDRIQI